MAQTYPNLEELRLPIRRSRGSGREIEVYMALFPKLRSLFLDLHFDPRQMELVKETEESVLQEAFLNAATDKKLGRHFPKAEEWYIFERIETILHSIWPLKGWLGGRLDQLFS